MTIEIAELIFSKGELSFNDTKVYFDGHGQYNVVKNQIPEYGTYEFVQQSGKVFLRTTPPILSGIRDLEIGISLGNLPVTITKLL